VSKVVAIVQARMGSTRLPGKVLADIGGRPAIAWTLTRARRSRACDDVWLACSEREADDPLAATAAALKFPVYRGDEDDVLSRFGAVARQTQADVVVRLTGDCPLIDPDVIDRAVARFLEGDVDYVSNSLTRTYPDGLDVEVFSRAALQRADAEARDPFLRLHVTPYIHGRLKERLPWGGFKTAQIVYPIDFSHLRWTLDEPDDLEFLRRLLPLLPENFGWLDVVALLTREPALLRINHRHGINEGVRRDLARLAPRSNARRQYSASNAYFDRAARTIPLASQTFSKSYQQWVRGAAPLFLARGRGCRVTDLDGNGYIDYVLGLLPIILGYGDPDVDEAILAALDDGIVFSLAHPKEAELAERLVRLIPCAEMVRFGKNGSDVTTAAVRLARAHTGRDKVAICGYHGWHDWYIGTTTRRLGVPASIQALSTTFPYNDVSALETLLAREGDAFAAVIIEAGGSNIPAPGFLQRLQELTAKHGVVLVFDEIITGFRLDLGGAQARYGVTPDLACFGKAMGNGMPISALVGRAEIMRKIEDIFFSTTFGGEVLSIAASIATLDKLERENVLPRLARRGEQLRDGANQIFGRHGLGETVSFGGEGWWPRIKLTNPPVDGVLLTSLLRQEFNANGLLLGASFNLCLAHDSDDVVAETLTAIDRAVLSVREALDSKDPASHLRGDPVRPTFSVR
jgi:glutamate-1-semialdehyde 2,1-aminomutase